MYAWRHQPAVIRLFFFFLIARPPTPQYPEGHRTYLTAGSEKIDLGREKKRSRSGGDETWKVCSDPCFACRRPEVLASVVTARIVAHLSDVGLHPAPNPGPSTPGCATVSQTHADAPWIVAANSHCNPVDMGLAPMRSCVEEGCYHARVGTAQETCAAHTQALKHSGAWSVSPTLSPVCWNPR